jgi:hypothetical protein
VRARSLSPFLLSLFPLPLDFGGATDTAIPLHNVSSEALKRVVAFCEDHVARPRPALATNTPEGKGKYVLDDWDKTFLAKLNQEQLFELILAANYLDIKTLLDATCKTVADMIIGKSPEQIRSLFQIKNDFSPVLVLVVVYSFC